MQNDNIQTSFPPFKSLSKGGNAKSDGLEVDSSRPPLHDGPKQARGDDTVFLSENGIFCWHLHGSRGIFFGTPGRCADAADKTLSGGVSRCCLFSTDQEAVGRTAYSADNMH